jgi:putative inorganic carbon (hco3(-)) transporter
MKPITHNYFTWFGIILLGVVWIFLLNFALLSGSMKLILAATLVLPSLILLVYFFLDPDIFLYAIVFLVPLSIKAELPGGFSLSFPSELLAILVLGYFVLNIKHITVPEKRILFHPVSKVLFVLMGWLLIDSLFSSMLLISFKRTIITILFIFVFYFMFLPKFNRVENILKFYLYYILGLLIPIVNGVGWHAQYQFKQTASYIMPQPFFAEHTIYGATLAFLLPMVFYLTFIPNEYNHPVFKRITLFLLFLVFLTAEYLSFSRAAWLSLFIIPLILIIFWFRIQLNYLTFGIIGLIVLVILNLNTISNVLEQNTSRSNRGNLKEQVESVPNIRNDISNLERINRWKCALRMFEEKPIMGFGSGTYQFIYGNFQLKPEMTRISTYKGDKGNAHSEFLNYLSETGIPGCLIFIALIFLTLKTAMKIIYNTANHKLVHLTVAIFLCLSTLYIHSFVNAFLDNDEIASLFYGSTAVIVAIDIYFYKSKT